MKYILILFFPLLSFGQKDTSRFIDNFYLEFNSRIGFIAYSEIYEGNPSSEPEKIYNKELTLDLDLNINFRNEFFKIGSTVASFEFANYRTRAFVLGGNLMAKSEYENVYFGPNLKYGRILFKTFDPRFDFIGFGLDLYIKNFHLEFYYDYILNSFIQTKSNYTNMCGGYIGYAFNLESFQKKK